MAQTISELEKERAELLKKIEEEALQAKQHNDGAENGEPEMTLNDFLKAAQEVIPDDQVTLNQSIPSQEIEPPTASNPTSSRSTIPKLSRTSSKSAPSSKKTAGNEGDANMANSTPNRSKSNIFSLILIITLFLTVFAVMGLVYVTLKEQMDALSESQKGLKTEVSSSLKSMTDMNASLAQKGKGEAFIALQKQVQQLTTEVQYLKKKVQQLEQQIDQKALATSANSAVQTVKQAPVVITSDVLDAKFAAYTQKIEEKLDAKINLILTYLKQNQATGQVEAANKTEQQTNVAPEKAVEKPSKPYTLPKQQKPVEEPKVSLPKAPESAETLSPKAPVVKLTATAEKPAEPEAPETPSSHYTEDTKWLKAQPVFNYTLQLASMTDKNAILKIKEQQGLKDARVIPQKRAGELRYVLVLGSFKNRSEADQLARQIKAKTGIAPWIRRVKDIAAYVA